MKKKLYLFHPESPGERVVVYRGWIKRLFYPSCFATIGEALKSSAIDLTDSEKFVVHIQDHLLPGEQVMCKICDKTIDEICGRW